MKFYTKPGACSIVGQVALAWANVTYERIILDAQSSKSPEFLAKNPQGAVPLLEDGDFILSQNGAIMPYLSAKYPQAHLFGSGDLHQRSIAKQWFSFVNTDIHSKFNLVFGPSRFASSETAQADLVTHAKALLRKLYEDVDQHLQKHEFLADELTIADVYLFVTANWADFKGVDLSGLDHLAAWRARVGADKDLAQVIAEQ